MRLACLLLVFVPLCTVAAPVPKTPEPLPLAVVYLYLPSSNVST